jgi:hypothetical protein
MTNNITPRQLDAAKLLEGALRGDRMDKLKLQEGIATSNLPELLVPTLNKILLEEYTATPRVWDQFATRLVVDDFRPVTFQALRYDDAGEDNQGDTFREGSLPTVGEYDEYPTAGWFNVTEQTLQVKKAGQRIRFSWESIVNDGQIGLLERLPVEMALKAAGKEDEEVTKQLVSPSGLNAGNFNSGNQNIIAGNPALTLEALENAIDAANKQTYNGRFITPVTQFALVIPRGLEMTARKILSVQEIRTQVDNNDGAVTTIAGNPIASSQVTIVVNDWLSKINSGAGNFWFLIPVPGQQLNPAVALGFLRGYETPELRIKSNGGLYLGGGEVPAREGSFDNDDWEMRIRHIATGGFIVPAGTIASTGSGS